MRARSHKYPDNDQYIDTTYYDEENEYLDLGFQRLKQLNSKHYPQFSFLKKLFIDNNNLKTLPDTESIPNLEQLTCSYNDLTTLPFYSKLTFLNIAHNKILSCDQYKNSNIKYFDCSYNQGFKYDFYLPFCHYLYINDTGTKTINLNLAPVLAILDCENNKLTKITGGNNLLEVNINYNCIKNLPLWPKLLRLMADHNDIELLPTYPHMISITVSHNNLNEIKKQPLLQKLIANNNCIKILGDMPQLELIDLSHNNIVFFNVPHRAEYISLQFNPLTNIILEKEVLKSIKELQVNFETYKHIYTTYYQNFDSVNVKINEEKLEQMLKKLSSVFNDSISRYVYRNFSQIKFKERDNAIYNIVFNVYLNYFSAGNTKTKEEIDATNEFKFLLYNFTKIYYKTIVITLFFNGYFN